VPLYALLVKVLDGMMEENIAVLVLGPHTHPPRSTGEQAEGLPMCSAYTIAYMT
jgi:hypothetical protein